MKVLTVCQPWAWAIIHGEKRVENRNWATSYRGLLAIHAGQSRNRLGDEEGLFTPPDDLVFGAIIGLVELRDCVPVDQIDDPYAEGPWCWLLANPRPIVPYRCQGQLKLWPPPADFLRFYS